VEIDCLAAATAAEPSARVEPAMVDLPVGAGSERTFSGHSVLNAVSEGPGRGPMTTLAGATAESIKTASGRAAADLSLVGRVKPSGQ
jgi:hypothetical protein